MRSSGNKGFTLLEMLIVVAIVAVLIAIAIPVFSGQLEKSREATDLANVRGAYAELSVAAMTESMEGVQSESAGAYYVDVDLNQAENDWQTALPLTIGNLSSDDSTHWIGSPRSGGTCRIKALNGEMLLFWSASSLGSISEAYNSFWTQKTSADGTACIYNKPTDTKNNVSPITLSAGDSFTIPKSRLVENGKDWRNGLFAFYLTENTPQADGSYKAIVDSGWLDKNDLQNGFTAANTYVSNLDDYVTAETVGDSVRFTITNSDGLTLLVNNNTSQNMNKLLNQVYVQRN